MTEYTFSMIKPDATKRNIVGKIIAYIESAGLEIVAQKMVYLSKQNAETFYAEHKERPFFNSLITYMTSGPVILQVLKGVNAVTLNREVMGATNPADAKNGTIRKEFGEDIEANSIHGSDSLSSAEKEISFFFSKSEITK